MNQFETWAIQQKESAIYLSDNADTLRDSLYYLDRYNCFAEIILKLNQIKEEENKVEESEIDENYFSDLYFRYLKSSGNC